MRLPLLGLLTCCLAVAPAIAQDAGWVSLFDGRTINGWTARGGNATFRVEDGTIVGTTAPDSPNTFLCTDANFRDFELEFEVKVDPALNSGVQIRSQEGFGKTLLRICGPQVEISSDGNAGYVYGEGLDTGWLSPTRPNEGAKAPFTRGTWNHFRILAVGPVIKTWVNGTPVESLHDARSGMRTGMIGLQVHSILAGQGPYEARWRNLRVRPLGQPARPTDKPSGSFTNEAGGMRWTHFTVKSPLPGNDWGTAGTPLCDLDGDGDLDMAISRWSARAFLWYERISDDEWVQHLISQDRELKHGLGAAAIDMDHDGHPDLVFDKVWFRNPGNLAAAPDAPWKPTRYDGGGHDILGTDIDGDGHKDLVTFNGKEILLFITGPNVAQRIVIASGFDHHGGMTPNGAGDIDGDGDNDLVIAGIWFENPGKDGTQWIQRKWPHTTIPKASYGTSIRAWVADVDGDGWNDIVYSDCDTSLAHVYFVRNLGRGRTWKSMQLPDPPVPEGSVDGTGSFHSLGVADFDGDGLLDVFAGEQEDDNQYLIDDGKLPMKTLGLKERGVIWTRKGRTDDQFQPVVIQVDNPGWHDAAIGDVDGDGDIDIVTKVWHADTPVYHADYWRNDTVK